MSFYKNYHPYNPRKNTGGCLWDEEQSFLSIMSKPITWDEVFNPRSHKGHAINMNRLVDFKHQVKLNGMYYPPFSGVALNMGVEE